MIAFECRPLMFKLSHPLTVKFPLKEVRAGASSGPWLAFLVPIILLRTGHQVLALDMLVTTTILFTFITETHTALLFVGGLGLTLLFTLSLNPTPPFQQIFILSFTICSTRNLLRLFPKSFTLGEALLLTHLFIVFLQYSPLFLVIFVSSVLVEYYSVSFTIFTFICMSCFALFLYIVIVWALLPEFASFHVLKMRQVYCVFTSSCLTMLISWAILLIFSFVIAFHHRRSKETPGSSSLTLHPNSSGCQSSDDVSSTHSTLKQDTSICSNKIHFSRVPSTPFWLRKVFHLNAGNVFAVGLQFAPWLLSLSASCLLVAFGLFEWVRRRGFDPVARYLNNLVDPFRDERDSGAIVFTPIALLLGLSIPVWWPEPTSRVYSVNVAFDCPKWSAPPYAWAGVLSIAVGDSMAALIGRRWGRTKWPGSHRTFLGSTASLLSQYICWIPLARSNEWPVYSGFLPILLGVLVEAYTDQIDNLVVPLVVMAAFASPSNQAHLMERF